MKLKIIILFLLCFIPSVCNGGFGYKIVTVNNNNNTVCEVAYSNETAGTNATLGNDTITSVAGSFTPDKTGGVCELSFRILKTGNPTSIITFEIWTAGALYPDAKIAIAADGGGCSGSGTCTGSEMTTSFATKTLTWSAGNQPSVANGTQYYFRALTSANDASNYYRLEYNATGTHRNVRFQSGSWATTDGFCENAITVKVQ